MDAVTELRLAVTDALFVRVFSLEAGDERVRVTVGALRSVACA